jgi:hypothetical protein
LYLARDLTEVSVVFLVALVGAVKVIEAWKRPEEGYPQGGEDQGSNES